MPGNGGFYVFHFALGCLLLWKDVTYKQNASYCIAGFYLLSYPFPIQTLSILNETCFKIFFDAVHLTVELILQKGVHLMVRPAPIFIVTANA